MTIIKFKDSTEWKVNANKVEWRNQVDAWYENNEDILDNNTASLTVSSSIIKSLLKSGDFVQVKIYLNRAACSYGNGTISLDDFTALERAINEMLPIDVASEPFEIVKILFKEAYDAYLEHHYNADIKSFAQQLVQDAMESAQFEIAQETKNEIAQMGDDSTLLHE